MLNNNPIASSDEYQKALLRLRDKRLKPLDIPILRAFFEAPDHTLTATKLAEVCGFSKWNESNLRFGTLAQRIGNALGYTPSKRKDGSFQWWQSAAVGSSEDGDGANFEWKLRPELVTALVRMKWV